MKRASLLLALATLAPSVASAQRATLESTDSLFDFSRQAQVFGEVSMFDEGRRLRAHDLERESAASWLPWGLVSMSDAPTVEPSFRLAYRFLLLDSLDFQGDAFGDRIVSTAHVVDLDIRYRTMVDIGDWYPGGVELELGGGAEIIANRLASAQTPDFAGDVGFGDETTPFVYGTEWQGAGTLFARFGPFFRWQSKLMFQDRSAVDPRNVSLDGRGALVFPDRADRSGFELALLDRFEVMGIGLIGEVQHGPSIWNFSEMLMAGLKEKVYIPQIASVVEAGVKSFDGFSTNLVELAVTVPNFPYFEVPVNVGGRMGFDGQFYSARAGFSVSVFRAEGTVQLVNRRQEPDKVFGFGVGFGGLTELLADEESAPMPIDAELAVYYNYLDHLDQLPGLRGTLFFTARIVGQYFSGAAQ